MMWTRRAMATFVLATTTAISPVWAADPFYTNLLETGKTALAVSDFATATHNLRVACFGLLDEPDNLAVGLSHLALAQHGAGDTDAFRATATRLLDLESRFSAYSNARIDSETRGAFEQRLVEVIPYERLQGLPIFRVAARERREHDIRALPPDRRRQALEGLIASAPDDGNWPLLLAELDLASGRAAAVRDTLAARPELRANDLRAQCLYGRSLAALGACAGALTDLKACGTPASDPGLAADWVSCLTRTGDWQTAATVLATLPSGWRDRKPFRALDRETRRNLKRMASSKPAVTEATPSETETAVTTPPTANEPASSTGTGATVAEAPPPTPAPAPPSRQQAPTPEPSTSPPAPAPSQAPTVATRVEALRGAFQSTTEHNALQQILDEGIGLAERYPNEPEAQFVVAEVAYRLRQWPRVVQYIQRGGVVSNRPALQFYLAVALYETGDLNAASVAMRACLPQLRRTAFVQAYAQKILGTP